MPRHTLLSSVLLATFLLPAQTFGEESDSAPPVKDRAEKAAEKADSKVRPSRPPSDQVLKGSEELLELQRQVRLVEVKAFQRTKSEEERLKELAMEKLAAERAVQVLKDQVDLREKELLAKRDRLLKAEKEAAGLEKETTSLLEPMRQFLDRLEQHVESGIPWKTESRKRAIRQVRDLLANSSGAPAALLAAIGRRQEDEETLGRLVEPGTAEIEAGNERRGVAAFHFGLLGVAFSNEQGKVSGYAQPGQKLEEGLEATRQRDAAKAYSMALEILKRQRVPCIVNLPIAGLPMESEEGR